MCTRYIPPDLAAIERHWQVRPSDPPRWPQALFPRARGPFLRAATGGDALQLVVGQWGLIPRFARSPVLKFATFNARFEELADKPSYREAWQRGQRCLIPAQSFDEPCWETGRNVWWRFRRQDGAPWALAGLWNAWLDRATGELHESYTLLTVNADDHPLMRRMHKPDPARPSDQQDKRSVVSIAAGASASWLLGGMAEAAALVQAPALADLAWELAPTLPRPESDTG